MTESITTNSTHPRDVPTSTTRHVVEGWVRPAWATDVCVDSGGVEFSRTAEAMPVEISQDGQAIPTPIRLVRFDTMTLESTGDLAIEIEISQVKVCIDIEELTVPEARKLAAAILELCDAAGDLEG